MEQTAKPRPDSCPPQKHRDFASKRKSKSPDCQRPLFSPPPHTAALFGQVQKCAHEGKSDARIENSVTNDVYQTLIAERSQDAEALAAKDADNAREQQLPSHRTLRPHSIQGEHYELRYYPFLA
jgi:hypothetical protein